MLRMIAEKSSGDVLLASTRAAIERIAEEFVRDSMRDPVFRKSLHDEAKRAARLWAKALSR